MSDQFYPGWKATCDGQPVAIYPGNYMFRAVHLPSGRHVVQFVYRPWSFRLGVLLAACSGGVILLFLIAGRRRIPLSRGPTQHETPDRL